jgi:multiple sugar transport system substrate-binding protein
MGTATNPVELTFPIFGGGGPHLSAVAHAVEAYEERHPDISVSKSVSSFYSKPVPYGDLQQKYFGERSDLVAGFVGGSLVPDAEEGRFLDLSELWQELGLEDAISAPVAELGTVDGSRYWIPTMAQWNPIFYNVDAMGSAGPPQSWSDLLARCDSLRQAGIDRPVAQAGVGWTPPAARWFSTLNLALNGPDFHITLSRGEAAWTDDRVRRVFDAWGRLFDAGCYGTPAMEAYGDQIGELSDGRAAMLNLGEWIFEHPSIADDDPVDFFTLPPIDEGLPDSEIVLVYGLAIPTGSRHPEEAKDLIRWLVSAEVQEEMYQSVPRVIVDRQIDPGYLTRHTKGLTLLENADRLVQLWEFLAPSPQAEIGLQLFTSFLTDPAGQDQHLAAAENARAEAFGDVE